MPSNHRVFTAVSRYGTVRTPIYATWIREGAYGLVVHGTSFKLSACILISHTATIK